MYYVVLPDGQKFGPADLSVLNKWAAEGRVLPQTTIEDAATGQRFRASDLAGIRLATLNPTPAPVIAPGTVNPPQPYAAYPRGTSPASAPGQGELNTSYIFGALGLASCVTGFGLCGAVGIVFPILGLVYANKSKALGNPNAKSASALSWVALVVQLLRLGLDGLFYALGFGFW